MKDIGHIMATLIDEGLVEDCLDDTITIMDLEEIPIIDLDDIDATIEDPGYILDEPLSACKQTEEYTSSYKKGSFTLPVQFFDISRNVSLLKKCRPISIKVVDCNIHPWYYKRMKYQATKDIEPTKDIELTKDEDTYKDMLKNALADFISFKCNDTNNDKSSSLDNSNSREIKLSSEQRLAVSKLKEDIEEKICTYKIDKAYDINHNNDNNNNAKRHIIQGNYLLPESDKIIDECILNENNDVIDPNDLLTYEAIAQTIVRNVCNGGVNYTKDEVLVCDKKPEEKAINVESYVADVELVSEMKIDDLVKETNEEASERIITSPILPCTVRPKKKMKEKLMKTSTVPNTHTIFKMCNVPRKTCHKFISADKVIPHYHYIIPNSTPTGNTNTNYSYLTTNTLNYKDNSCISQYNNTRDTYSHYLNQPKQYVNKSMYPTNSKPPTYNSLRTLETNANCVGCTSGVGHNQTTCNSTLLHSALLRTPPQSNVRKPTVFKNNVNPNAYAPYPTPSSDYLNTFTQQANRCPVPAHPTFMDNTINVGNVKGSEFSKENYRLFPQHSAPPFIPNSLYPRTEYITNKRLQYPSQMTVAYVEKKMNHPLLTKLLNSNRTSVITSTDNILKTNRDIMPHQFSTGPTRSAIKPSNKVNLHTLIAVISQKNCDSSLKTANDSTSIQNIIKPRKVNKAMQETTTLNMRQDDTKFDNNRSLKTLQPAQHDFNIIMTSEQIPRKISSYSAPILPIPTFKKGLEILSKLQPTVPPKQDGYSVTNNSKSHTNKSNRREYNEIINMKRKRIAGCDDKIPVCTKSRKISLQEYKQRKMNNDIKTHVNSTPEHTTKVQSKETKLHRHVGGVSMGMPYLGRGS